MRRKRIFTTSLILVVLVLGGFLMAAKGVREDLAAQSTIEQVLQRGVLRVGMSTFVPWAMNDKQGNLVGFEIDVARRLARDMGVKVEFVPTKWSGILPALLTGKFDVIIGGMGITPERNVKVNFSMPYDYTGMSLVASKKLARGYKSLNDFNKPVVTIAARTGTTAAAAAKKHMPRARLRLFDDESQAVQELLNDRVHALVASAPLPAFQAIEYPDRLFLPLKDDFTQEPIGFAIVKGDVDTLNFLNSWIVVVESEGWLKERKHYWFETKDWKNLIE
ncbi:MAG TPA: transporter substrate-binding domain-containing protein [Deltaproteobacteria bacterium]|jgi:polar amino acid transport system substrate-binding protein|nr:transporter substrate-binding domain-containing protein [Deltaproteobacteria bacterium]HRW79549.1 transporter substrate-binding domain-containing protein [Desulfomonilia bacterium]NMD39747.1 transporter substrate-binding domain-containing protein [Deltaproteobacteria bacterium]HOA44796.1 transporter substrate-binding domain-containing protein [Deltaproteobacteria bacterium]HOC76376.1 transporter substrate-binding domain-containing protein [Deltaproteobacteria bacterium]